MLLFVHYLFLFQLHVFFVFFCCWTHVCGAALGVLSILAIILLRKGELVDLLLLP